MIIYFGCGSRWKERLGMLVIGWTMVEFVIRGELKVVIERNNTGFFIERERERKKIFCFSSFILFLFMWE